MEERKLIKNAVSIIRLHHGLGVPKEQEEKMWQIYWTKSPEMQPFREYLESETAKSGRHDLLVSGKFVEEDIKKRYDMICKQIEFWQKRIEKEWSYEDGYKNGLTYAEKQFRNLFS